MVARVRMHRCADGSIHEDRDVAPEVGAQELHLSADALRDILRRKPQRAGS